MRFVATGVAAVAVCALVAACAPERSDTVPMPVPVPTSSASPTPAAAPTAEPDPDPTLLPQGAALANRDYFDFVNKKLVAVNANPSSSAIVENLINAGFPKKSLEVTPDRTTPLRGPADSIQFAVHTSKDCLVGQFKDGHYSSMVAPTVNGEACLVGDTQKIP